MNDRLEALQGRTGLCLPTDYVAFLRQHRNRELSDGYAMVNFFLFMQHSGGGDAVALHGKYVLLNHGKLIRELTASEYVALKANELRGFSGHWMLLYFMPAAYFLFLKPHDAT